MEVITSAAYLFFGISSFVMLLGGMFGSSALESPAVMSAQAFEPIQPIVDSFLTSMGY